MKFLLAILLTAISFDAAADAQSCEKKVTALVKSVAKNMGVKSEIGVHLTTASGEPDLRKRPVLVYSSGSFITDDGFLSNSGAEVSVADAAKACAIVKVSVYVGASK
jgi:hypothetical protein